MKRSLIAASISALLASGLIAFAQSPTLQQTMNYVGDNATWKPTFSATARIVPASTPTDMCTLTGSATRTVKLRRVVIAGRATAVQTFGAAFWKRSTANSGGTAVTTTITPLDSQNTASAVARSYTANPTLGTAVGVIADPYYVVSNLTTGVGNGTLQYYFGMQGSSVVLRGTSQVFAVNGNSETITGGELTCTIEWTEETGG